METPTKSVRGRIGFGRKESAILARPLACFLVLLGPTRVLQSVTMLTVAAVVGQLIGIANVYLITHHYTTGDFGHYSVFISYVALASTCSLLACDKAIPNLFGRHLAHYLHGIAAILILFSVGLSLGGLLLGYKFALQLVAVVFRRRH